MNGRGVVDAELVVARSDASPVFEAAEGALDRIAAPKGVAVVWGGALSDLVRLDHRLGPALRKPGPKTSAVICGVGDAALRRRDGGDQHRGDRRIAALPRGDLEGERPSITI